MSEDKGNSKTYAAPPPPPPLPSSNHNAPSSSFNNEGSATEPKTSSPLSPSPDGPPLYSAAAIARARFAADHNDSFVTARGATSTGQLLEEMEVPVASSGSISQVTTREGDPPPLSPVTPSSPTTTRLEEGGVKNGNNSVTGSFPSSPTHSTGSGISDLSITAISPVAALNTTGNSLESSQGIVEGEPSDLSSQPTRSGTVSSTQHYSSAQPPSPTPSAQEASEMDSSSPQESPETKVMRQLNALNYSGNTLPLALKKLAVRDLMLTASGSTTNLTSEPPSSPSSPNNTLRAHQSSQVGLERGPTLVAIQATMAAQHDAWISEASRPADALVLADELRMANTTARQVDELLVIKHAGNASQTAAKEALGSSGSKKKLPDAEAGNSVNGLNDNSTIAASVQSRNIISKSITDLSTVMDQGSKNDSSADPNNQSVLTELPRRVAAALPEMPREKRIKIASVYVENAMHGSGPFYRGAAAQWVYRKHRSPWFRNFMFAVILLHCALVLVEDPSSRSTSAWTWASSVPFTTPAPISFTWLTLIESSLVAIYWIDTLLKTFHFGFKRFLRQGEHKLGLTVLLVITTDVALAVVAPGLAYGVRFSRPLRPFLFLSRSSHLRDTMLTVLKTLPSLGNIFSLLLFTLGWYAIVGFLLFRGTYPTVDGVATTSVTGSFDTLSEAMLTMFVLLTTENYPAVLVPAFQTSPYTAIFFVTFILFTLYWLVSVFLAAMFTRYVQLRKERVIRDRKNERLGLLTAFAILDHNSDGLVEFDSVLAVMHKVNPNVSMSQMEILYSSLNSGRDSAPNRQSGLIDALDFFAMADVLLLRFVPDKKPPQSWGCTSKVFGPIASRLPRDKLFNVVTGRFGKGAILGSLLLHTLCFVSLALAEDLPWAQSAVAAAAIARVINVYVFGWLYALEMLLKVVAWGWAGFWAQKWNRFDLILSIASTTCIWFHYGLTGATAGGMEITADANLVIRLLAVGSSLVLLRLVSAIERLQTFTSTLMKIIRPLLPVLTLVAAIVYAYAVVGVEMFEGRVTPLNSVAQGRVVSYESFGWACLTLFQGLTTNDWHVNMYDAMEATQHSASLYFVSFQSIVVLLMVNFMIAIFIEVFRLYSAMAERGHDLLLEVVNSSSGSTNGHIRRKRARTWEKDLVHQETQLTDAELAELNQHVPSLDLVALNKSKGAQGRTDLISRAMNDGAVVVSQQPGTPRHHHTTSVSHGGAGVMESPVITNMTRASSPPTAQRVASVRAVSVNVNLSQGAAPSEKRDSLPPPRRDTVDTLTPGSQQQQDPELYDRISTGKRKPRGSTTAAAAAAAVAEAEVRALEGRATNVASEPIAEEAETEGAATPPVPPSRLHSSSVTSFLSKKSSKSVKSFGSIKSTGITHGGDTGISGPMLEKTTVPSLSSSLEMSTTSLDRTADSSTESPMNTPRGAVEGFECPRCHQSEHFDKIGEPTRRAQKWQCRNCNFPFRKRADLVPAAQLASKSGKVPMRPIEPDNDLPADVAASPAPVGGAKKTKLTLTRPLSGGRPGRVPPPPPMDSPKATLAGLKVMGKRKLSNESVSTEDEHERNALRFGFHPDDELPPVPSAGSLSRSSSKATLEISGPVLQATGSGSNLVGGMMLSPPGGDDATPNALQARLEVLESRVTMAREDGDLSTADSLARQASYVRQQLLDAGVELPDVSASEDES